MGRLTSFFSPRRANHTNETRLFYASDVHGSDRCWKKFLQAGKFYKASLLIMGGDLAGKAFVPLVEEGDGRWHVHFQGRDEQLSTEQLPETEQAIRDNGMYPFRTTPAELQRLAGDEALQSGRFS